MKLDRFEFLEGPKTETVSDLTRIVNNNSKLLGDRCNELSTIVEKLDKKARVAGVGFLMLAALTFINTLEHDKFETRLSKLEQKGE